MKILFDTKQITITSFDYPSYMQQELNILEEELRKKTKLTIKTINDIIIDEQNNIRRHQIILLNELYEEYLNKVQEISENHENNKENKNQADILSFSNKK